MKYQGQCLCGAIQYEVDAFSSNMGHCHCSMCRKFHGAAFATFGEAKVDDFRWTKGEPELQAYTAYNGSIRRFCKHCGSSMTFEPADHDGSLIELALGTLDSSLEIDPDIHFFVGNKASWYTISDDLPQCSSNRQSKQINRN